MDTTRRAIANFEEGTAFPVDLKQGPLGDLFYVDFYGGAVHRIGYTPSQG